MKKIKKSTPVEIALPVYNEEKQLQDNIRKITAYLNKTELYAYRIKLTIVDNASTDKTPVIAKDLAEKNKDISYLRLEKKGRGRALRNCWLQSHAQILSYMDIDLSADLKYLPQIFSPLAKKEAEIVIGSRLAPGSRVQGRTWVRELMSRGYNLLIRLFFRVSFKDAQCGFKALTKDAFQLLEPKIVNNQWFFDSELLIIAEKMKLKIKEVPIFWRDDPESTVKVAGTVFEDLRGLYRLYCTKPWKTS